VSDAGSTFPSDHKAHSYKFHSPNVTVDTDLLLRFTFTNLTKRSRVVRLKA
jgi:hypothetical protein